MITIREETPQDIPAIHEINARAFQREGEAVLVDRLRSACGTFLSLVAEEDGVPVGHILFTPVTLDAIPELAGMGLAPTAVLPEKQRSGVGGALIRAGIEILRSQGCPFVIVLGHASYYARFGFEPASRYGIAPQWKGIPDEAFMILPLEAEVLQHAAGVVRYHPVFDEGL